MGIGYPMSVHRTGIGYPITIHRRCLCAAKISIPTDVAEIFWWQCCLVGSKDLQYSRSLGLISVWIGSFHLSWADSNWKANSSGASPSHLPTRVASHLPSMVVVPGSARAEFFLREQKQITCFCINSLIFKLFWLEIPNYKFVFLLQVIVLV